VSLKSKTYSKLIFGMISSANQLHEERPQVLA
jgi:hypothetical protein